MEQVPLWWVPILGVIFAFCLLIKWVAAKVDEMNGLA
jgi:hypothetical protein